MVNSITDVGVFDAEVRLRTRCKRARVSGCREKFEGGIISNIER